MGFIYKIEVEGELYVGSTKEKYLSNRQGQHNQGLNNPNYKNYNYPLYKFCREKKVKKIICELIVEADNNELVLLEQEYINMLEPTLNSQKAYRTEKEKIEQRKEFNKKHNEINNKKKGKCYICNKEMLKNSINTHIKNIHKS
jgi:hypothetical protein